MAKEGKRAQFYLVSAIVITGIIMAIIAVTNYSTTNQEDLRIVQAQINTEASNVLDYGINQNMNSGNINLLMQNFTNAYIGSEKGENNNIYFVFGDSTNITLKGYQNNAHNVFLNTFQVTSSPGSFLFSIVPGSQTQINLTVDNYSNYFTINPGENFYSVVSDQERGENYVIAG